MFLFKPIFNHSLLKNLVFFLMDLITKTSFSQALSPITTPSNSILPSHFHSSDSSFPIIAIAILGILATSFLLLSYYIFVIKCCPNRSRIDLGTRRQQDPLMIHSPAMENNRRGLDESVIRKIPIFRFKIEESKVVVECAVCLNEFEDDEKLRMIPNCNHVFHIDCIDVWLQNNANCPLCRASVSCNNGQLLSQDPNLIIHGDEDFVVIELGGGGGGDTNSSDQTFLGDQERLNSSSISTSPLKLVKKARKFHKGTSMGDECINIRDQDEQFAIQPIRRSISIDSSADRRLYLAVQEAIRLNRDRQVSPIEGCSSSSRVRSFFSFGNSRGSKTAILPVSLKP